MIMRTSQKGFTLIELMIVLVIMGILAAIIYPSYTNYVAKARRVEGQIELLNLAVHMEKYRMEHKNSYEGVTLANLPMNPITPNHYYQLAIANLSADTYLLEAIPLNKDSQCGTLTLDQLGEKSQTGTATDKECWG